MVTLATVARNLIIVAVSSLLLALQTFFWPILPLGYEGTLALGGVTFSLGASLSLIAFVLAVMAHLRHRGTPSYVALCIWSGVVLTACIVFGSADLWLRLFST